jgi:hypothetical protein
MEKLPPYYLSWIVSFQKQRYTFEMLPLERISYTKYVNGRLTVLVAFCVETAFYNGLLKER